MKKEEAVSLWETGFWKEMSEKDIAEFQLFESKLCLPFSVFHAAVEKVLKRPVWTHEFADTKKLRQEFLGERSAPTLEQIINLIPREKRILVFS